jgi:hypothetical protein
MFSPGGRNYRPGGKAGTGGIFVVVEYKDGPDLLVQEIMSNPDAGLSQAQPD